MNRKDFKTLSESYEKIFENTLTSMIDDDQALASSEVPMPSPEVSTLAITNSPATTEVDEAKQMVIANLKTLIGHAEKALNILQGGKELEAWMNDKISVASNDVVQVANALEFGD
jgi:hypothetical protein